MQLDPIENFKKVTVSTGYDDSATSIVLEAGEGAVIPDPSSDGEYNLVWWNFTDYPDPADDPNVEIVRATGKSTDTLTVERPSAGNEYLDEGDGNTAKTHNTANKTYKMALCLTKSILGEIAGAIPGINEITGTTANMDYNYIYIANNAGLVTLTLPTDIMPGETIEVVGKGAGGWKIAQNADQTIHFGNKKTTTGTGGYLQSSNRYDSIKLLCVTDETDFVVVSSIGNITVA